MTTYEYLSELFKVHSLLKDDETLSRLIAVSSDCFDMGDVAVKDLLVQHSSTVDGRVNAKLTGLSASIRELQLGDTILKLNSLHASLEAQLSSVQEPTRETVILLIGLLRQVINTYESFIMSPSVGTVYACMLAIRGLNQAHADLIKTLTEFHHFVLPKLEFEGNSELSICFSWTSDYRQFIAKLSSIDKLYSELCALVNVSTSEFPLRVIRVEYGSLWLRLFCESKVTALLTSLIASAVSYMHRNFTNEGKIEAIPKKVSAVEEVLELTEKVKAAGIDTKEINENVQKSAVIISQELNTLLMHEPNVTINGKGYSVGQDVEDKFLKQSFGLYLTADDEEGEQADEG